MSDSIFKLQLIETGETEFDIERKVTSEFSESFLPDILEEVKLFLKGCGYFIRGELESIEDHETILSNEEVAELNSYRDLGLTPEQLAIELSTLDDYRKALKEK